MVLENHPEELAELEARAHYALEHAEQVEPHADVSDYQPLLRVWDYPAFLDHICWTVLKPARQEMSEMPLIVREVVWERGHDLGHVTDPIKRLQHEHPVTPTLAVRDTRLPRGEMALLLEELAALPVPVAGIEASWGLDGETFGFENCASGFLRVRLEWWGDGPREWQGFTQAIARLREKLEQCFVGGNDEAG